LKVSEEAELSSSNFPGVASTKSLRIGLLVILGAAALYSPGVFAQTTTAASATAKPKTGRTHAPASDPAASATPVKSFGDKNAPITMEVFSDYQCPSCRSFYEQTLKPLLGPDGYVAAGKVYLVHRDFPLEMHAYSADAARWANAAAKIGKFQDVDAALWDNQNTWSADGNVGKFVEAAMSPADFKRVQALLKSCSGLPPKSKADRSVPQVEPGCSVDSFIVQDIGLGYAVPVQATPTFVVYYKGQKYPASSGMVSYPILKQFFDSLLSQ
jgi:protein-disulfide isomerase